VEKLRAVPKSLAVWRDVSFAARSTMAYVHANRRNWEEVARSAGGGGASGGGWGSAAPEVLAATYNCRPRQMKWRLCGSALCAPHPRLRHRRLRRCPNLLSPRLQPPPLLLRSNQPLRLPPPWPARSPL